MEIATVLGLSAGGGVIGFITGTRRRKLDNESIHIKNLENIMEQQNKYIEQLNNRINEQEAYFNKKCEVMQLELDALKKKLSKI